MDTKEGVIEVGSLISTRRETCRLCDSRKLVTILDLGDQYLPRFPKQIDLSLPTAPLVLVHCSDCGLLQLRDTVNPDLLFREYWYRSSVNQTMKDALRDIVKDGLLYHRSGRWLDIGANDGYLLSQVPPSFERIACEPALNLADQCQRHANLVVSNYFSAEHEVFRGADVITSAAMFYDLDDPNKFVRDICQCLTDDGVWINQLNDAPTMLSQNAFDGVCHEHLIYYDVPRLANLYHECGLTITDIGHNDVNGGSVRVAARKSKSGFFQANLMGLFRCSEKDLERFSKRAA